MVDITDQAHHLLLRHDHICMSLRILEQSCKLLCFCQRLPVWIHFHKRLEIICSL